MILKHTLPTSHLAWQGLCNYALYSYYRINIFIINNNFCQIENTKEVRKKMDDVQRRLNNCTTKKYVDGSVKTREQMKMEILEEEFMDVSGRHDQFCSVSVVKFLHLYDIKS